jgi:hypothetical protein
VELLRGGARRGWMLALGTNLAPSPRCTQVPTKVPTSSPTTLANFCSKYTYYDSTYGTTVCAGMALLTTSDLAYKSITSSFDAAIESCQSWCFSTYSSATGGWLAQGSSGTHTCYCKSTFTSVSTRTCYTGVGFYLGAPLRRNRLSLMT